MTYTTYMYYHL